MPGAVRIALLAAILLAGPAAAYTEAEAPTLRPDVVAAWHTPATVAAHSQWSGFLRLAPGSNVTSAQFQVCRVGSACFAPPAPAQRDGDVLSFNTSAYLAGGRPVDYQPGWTLGVQWLLSEAGNRTVAFPQGVAPGRTDCPGAFACQDTHYIVLSVAAATKGTPALPPLAALAVLGIAASLGRRRHG